MRDFMCSLALFLLLAVCHPVSSKRIPRWWMKVAQRQGPNACVVEEVPNSDLEFWTECRYWLPRKICGKSTRIRFECCEGFDRISGEDGCTRVKPLVNVLETAEQLGATKWAQYIREAGLAGELEAAGAYTLFAPTNEAFENVRRSLRGQLDTYRGNPNNPILLYHLLPTKLISDNFGANIMVETRHQGHNVRVNRYSNGMTTINCALLIRKDQHATNGVVHIINSVLDPSVGILQNVADMVLNDGRFTVLSEVLEKSGYINVLRTMQASITILAPSDEAFQKLPESRREKIINDREARLALLQNHVIPHVICESAVTGKHAVSTVGGDKLTFNCDIDGSYVERTKLRGNFNLGKNGIIHMIDDVLLPDRAKNLIELAESRNLFTFVDLVRRAGLEETLSHTGDYTFFVPDEAAWYALDSEVLSDARRDLDLAGQLVRFHGAYGRHLTNAITDNQAIMSLNEEDPVRLQVWRGGLGVEDARITEPDIQAQNGAIHIINKVITPSNQSLADTLNSLPGSYSTFLEMVSAVSGDSGSLLNLGPGDEVFYTFFVPSDDAFNKLDQTTQRRLRSGGEYAEELVKKHLAVNMFPPTAFKPNLIYTVNGMSEPFDVKMTRNNVLTVNGEDVESSHLCANGVIHTINKVFLPGETYTYSSSSHRSSTTYNYGGRSRSSSSSSSNRRTYKQTVTFAENYGGGTELPGVTQSSVTSDGISATRRRTSTKTSKRRGKGSSSSVSSSPSADYPSSPSTSTSLNDGKRRNRDPTDTMTLEETHLQGSGLEAKEQESSVNALGDSETHAEGSYAVREGSYRSSSYNPSASSSSNTQKTIVEDDEETPQRGDYSPSLSSPSTTSRPYDPDLDRYIPSSSRRYNHHQNTDLSTTPSSSRSFDSNLDNPSSPSSSSSSSDPSTRLESALDYPNQPVSSHSEGSDTTSRGSDPNSRGSDIASRGSYSTSRGSDPTPRESEPSSRGSSTASRGSNTISRGSSPTSRGSGPTSRESDPTSRGSDNSFRGSDTSFRGSDPTSRGSDPISRGSDPTSRGSDTSFRGSDSTYRESDSRYRGSNTASRGSDSTNGGSDPNYGGSNSTYRRYDSTYRGSESSRGTESNYGGYDSTNRGYASTDRGLESTDRGSESTYRRHDSSYRGSNSNSRGSEPTYRGYDSFYRGTESTRRKPDSTYRRLDSNYRGADSTHRGSSYNYGGSDANTRESGSNLGGSRGYSSSYNYTYNYSTRPGGVASRGEEVRGAHRGGGGPSSQHYGNGALSNSSSSYSSSSAADNPHRNTVKPVSPGGGKFSYVGHSYGQDVVGHTQGHATPSPLPYSLGQQGASEGVRSLGVERAGKGRSLGVERGEEVRRGNEGGLDRRTYKYSQISHVQAPAWAPTTSSSAVAAAESSSISTNSIVSRRRYHTTRTSYYSGQNPSIFPASGLTGDEEMYADGAEFAEGGYMAAQGNPEVSITREEAKVLRRRWRKKRHHGKRRGGRKNRAGRRRRGRKGRRHRGAAKVATPSSSTAQE